jgi:D-serine deaminase-like pyridoxal phosphate-dependent protein
VEVDIGMNRCGVEAGEPALRLARAVQAEEGLRFVDLPASDGQRQLLPDLSEKAGRCRAGLEQLLETRRMLEAAGVPVQVLAGCGDGAWSSTAVRLTARCGLSSPAGCRYWQRCVGVGPADTSST